MEKIWTDTRQLNKGKGQDTNKGCITDGVSQRENGTAQGKDSNSHPARQNCISVINNRIPTPSDLLTAIWSLPNPPTPLDTASELRPLRKEEYFLDKLEPQPFQRLRYQSYSKILLWLITRSGTDQVQAGN